MNTFIKLNSGFNFEILEQHFIQIFAINKVSSFLHELMFLGFQYYFLYPEVLSLELFKGTFYIKKLLRLKTLTNTKTLYKINKLHNIKYKPFNIFDILNFFKTNLEFLNPISTSLYLMAKSGAKSNLSQVEQLVSMRGYISNIRNIPIKFPIMHSFNKGLNILDYIISSYGVRKGILDTAINTSESGYLTRRIVESIQDIITKEIYCGSDKLISIKNSHDIFGNIKPPKFEFIKSKYIHYNTTNFKNSFINKDSYKILNPKNLNVHIYIRTPFTCNSGRTFCKICIGFNYNSKVIPNLGLGILAGESIGEPSTQLTLRTFHTGGSLSSNMIITKLQTHNFKDFRILFYNKILDKNSFLKFNLISIKKRFNFNLTCNNSKLLLSNCKNNKELIKFKNIGNIKGFLRLKKPLILFPSYFILKNQPLYNMISKTSFTLFKVCFYKNFFYNICFFYYYSVINFIKNNNKLWNLIHVDTNILFINKTLKFVLNNTIYIKSPFHYKLYNNKINSLIFKLN